MAEAWLPEAFIGDCHALRARSDISKSKRMIGRSPDKSNFGVGVVEEKSGGSIYCSGWRTSFELSFLLVGFWLLVALPRCETRETSTAREKSNLT